MEKIFLIFLVSFVYSSTNRICANYKCENLPDGECYKLTMEKDKFEYALQSCLEDELCDFDSDVYHGKCSKHLPRRLPGEFCTAKKDCLNERCNNETKTCEGIREGGPCTLDEECDSGLFCSKEEGKCEDVVKEGKNCTEKKCGPGLVCDGEKCVHILSIDIDKPSKVSAACKTFYIIDGNCQKGPVLNRKGDEGEGPIQCKNVNNCEYKINDEDTIKSNCVCGINEEGKSYCNPGIGDIDFEDVILA